MTGGSAGVGLPGYCTRPSADPAHPGRTWSAAYASSLAEYGRQCAVLDGTKRSFSANGILRPQAGVTGPRSRPAVLGFRLPDGQGAQAVDRGGDFVAAGQGVIPGVSLVGGQHF